MSEATRCAFCGAAMVRGGVCSVCESHDAPASRPAPVPATTLVQPAPTVLGRLWQSGRIAVATSAVAFALGSVAPLVTVTKLGIPAVHTGASAWRMVTGDGLYGRELKSALVAAIPLGALAMLQFLWSRRDGRAMVTSRPVVFVTAVLPLIAVAMAGMILSKRHQFDYRFAPGVGLVLLGTIAGLIGAVTFGRAVPEHTERTRYTDEVD